jgi:PII-like signaling protein
MKTIDVILVRVYLTEAESHLDTLLKRLHDWGKVRGVTVFRGITGFGKSGKIHASSLLDISLNLPVVLEFFDEPKRAEEVLQYLNTLVEPGHIVSWPARLTVGDED